MEIKKINQNLNSDFSLPILELKGINKDYGAVRALDNVDLKLYKNEILGLVGDNAAGKSTLIKIIAGVLQPNKGTIFFEGAKVSIKNCKDSMNLGIETIFQDMNLINSVNIIRNIFMGREITNKFGRLNMKKMWELSTKLLHEESSIQGIKSPMQYVNELSGGQKQAVAIARAMFFKNKILMLNEPTSALSVRETNTLLKHLLKLKEDGISIILITHNIYQAFQVADRFMVLSRGKKVLDIMKKDTELDEITNIIVNS